MFDATVLALRVLSDGDQVHVGVRGLVALDGDAGSHVGVEVKGLPEQQVHGGVACSDRCLQGSYRTEVVSSGDLETNTRQLNNQHLQTFQPDLALVHRLFSVWRNHPPASRSFYRCDIPLLPSDRSLQGQTNETPAGF